MMNYIIPSRRAINIFLIITVVFAIVSGVGYLKGFSVNTLQLIMLLLLFAAFAFDAVMIWRLALHQQLSAERHMPHHFIVNQSAVVKLILTNNSEHPVELSVFDHVPETFELVGDSQDVMPLKTTLPSTEHVEIAYRVKPRYRGKAVFHKVQLRLLSPLKLWQSNHYLPLADEVKTYPDFRKIDQDDLLSNNMQTQGSITHQRKRGTGTDFSQLREYRQGDALNHIDYKATARMNKLIAKEFQIERDQQVMILLDCSRRLRVFQSGLSHFDYALNTTIFLARTVLNQGDAVGLMSFGSGDFRYCQPRKGRNSVNRLLNQVYDLDTSRDAPDYIGAAEQLMVRQKRRSLIIVVTSLQEEDIDEIKTMLKILQKRHIVVIANLKEPLLGEEVSIRDLDDAIFYASRETYSHYRQTMLQQISNKKLILLDTYPQSLTARLLNLYINIKQAGVF